VLIDLVDGLSLGSIVLVSVTNNNLPDHDVRLRGEAAKCFPSNGDQAQAIPSTFLVIIEMLLGNGGLGNDQILSHRTIDKGGL
jgi:hypothetical protein